MRDREASPQNQAYVELLPMFREYEDNPTLDMRNWLIEQNLGLVRVAVRHMKSRPNALPYEDVFQIGCIGLVKAVERFSVRKGVAFSSFALPYIRGEIQHFYRDKGDLIKVPQKLNDTCMYIVRTRERLRKQNGCAPTEQEICDALEITTELYKEALYANECTRHLLQIDPDTEDWIVGEGDPLAALEEEEDLTLDYLTDYEVKQLKDRKKGKELVTRLVDWKKQKAELERDAANLEDWE